MTPDQYLRTIAANWKRPTLDPKSFDEIACKTPILPNEYLTFAEKDLRLGGTRGLVNALGNAKRAIDCQIAGLLTGLGLACNGNFPEKLARVDALGIVAPRILRKVVQLRNSLEHDFHRPQKEEVEDAVDIATLFLESLKPIIAGGYMSSGWIADDLTANPWPFAKEGGRLSWDTHASPTYTFSSGIYIESDLALSAIRLDLVNNNRKIASVQIDRSHMIYPRLQAFLIKCRPDNYRFHSRSGARAFLRLLADLK